MFFNFGQLVSEQGTTIRKFVLDLLQMMVAVLLAGIIGNLSILIDQPIQLILSMFQLKQLQRESGKPSGFYFNLTGEPQQLCHFFG